MPMTLAEFLAHVKRIASKAYLNRISTADRYLATLAKCAGGLCPTDRARYQGPEFDKRLKETGQIPVYHNNRTNVVSFSKAAEDVTVEGREAKFLAAFDGVYTSTKEDRDSDVLEAAGCTLDEKMPLLWQHDSTAPIGAHLKTLSQDKLKVIGRCGIADTVLGRDAAYLAELDCLRLSQGFRPTEFEAITQKSGKEEIVTGFHVIKYEMMEISLVSVPSNTDAIVQAFHRNKLASPLLKSTAKSLDERRQRVYTAGFGVKAMKMPTGRTVVGIKRCPATGKVKPLVARKDVGEFEKSLATACGQIVHSGDYGLCFYKAGDTADTYGVWWTMGDADDPANTNEEGTPYTSADDIKASLGAVPGVSAVEIGSEANPPYDEGWREVYPEVRDWTTGGANSSQSSEPVADTAPAIPPTGDGKGHKDGAPVSGSAEAIAAILTPLVGPFLSQSGTVEDGAEAVIQSTFPDNVIVRVGGSSDGTGATYYRLTFSLDGDGNPTLSGTPEQVELQTVVAPADSQPAPTDSSGNGATDSNGSGAASGASSGSSGQSDSGTPPSGASIKPSQKRTFTKWVKVANPKPPAKKGKLGKKDSSMLKEAVEHLDDAMGDGRKMPVVCKTLVKRAYDLVSDVMKSDGTGQGDGAPGQAPAPAAPATMNDAERRLWAILMKSVTSPHASKTALAAILTELAMLLEASDVSALLASYQKS